MDFDYKIKHPANIICCGGTQSGKSTLVCEIIKRRDEIKSKKTKKPSTIQ